MYVPLFASLMFLGFWGWLVATLHQQYTGYVRLSQNFEWVLGPLARVALTLYCSESAG